MEHSTLLLTDGGRVPRGREKASLGLFGQRILGAQGPAMWARRRMWLSVGTFTQTMDSLSPGEENRGRRASIEPLEV